mmetsp:Transcript_8136/g.18155  ORF Transcript_8136/g.18155 Transcript_8136/m.18155 type:complete len:517 (+) Transcript_8136:77-1627(+)
MGCTQGSNATVRNTTATSKTPQSGSARKKSFFDDYLLGPSIGKGSFGSVRVTYRRDSYQDTLPHDGKLAVKIVDMKPRASPPVPTARNAEGVDWSLASLVKWEIAVWKRVTDASAPNCVKLHEVFWEGSMVYMVMEKCDMTLKTALESTIEVSERLLCSLFYQMATAVAGLHKIGIAHRDIKPDNFLVNAGMRLKLADFGFSTVLMRGVPMTDLYGTAPYMSPEMIVEGVYDEKVDIWSLGVVMYVLVFGTFPYYPAVRCPQAMQQAIADGTPAPSFRPFKAGSSYPAPTKALQVVIEKCLSRDPQMRISGDDLLEATVWKRLSNPRAFEASGSVGGLIPGGGDFQAMLRNAIKIGALSGGGVSAQPNKDPEPSTPLQEFLQAQGIKTSAKNPSHQHGGRQPQWQQRMTGRPARSSPVQLGGGKVRTPSGKESSYSFSTCTGGSTTASSRALHCPSENFSTEKSVKSATSARVSEPAHLTSPSLMAQMVDEITADWDELEEAAEGDPCLDASVFDV